jgi:hypothetical protein
MTVDEPRCPRSRRERIEQCGYPWLTLRRDQRGKFRHKVILLSGESRRLAWFIWCQGTLRDFPLWDTLALPAGVHRSLSGNAKQGHSVDRLLAFWRAKWLERAADLVAGRTPPSPQEWRHLRLPKG